MRIAVLDDYPDCARPMADRDSPAGCETSVFTAPIAEAARAATRAPFDVLCLMRDRMPLTESLIGQLPRLRFISYSGISNLALDGAAAAARGIIMSNIDVRGGRAETNEFIWALLMATVRDIPGNDRAMRAGG